MASAQPDPSRASDAPIDRGVAAFGQLLRSISRAVSRGGGDADARTNEPDEPAPAVARTLSRRDTTATKLNEDAVRADADAKLKSELLATLASEREREEANASDDEDADEDEGFRMKREEEDAAATGVHVDGDAATDGCENSRRAPTSRRERRRGFGWTRRSAPPTTKTPTMPARL